MNQKQKEMQARLEQIKKKQPSKISMEQKLMLHEKREFEIQRNKRNSQQYK